MFFYLFLVVVVLVVAAEQLLFSNQVGCQPQSDCLCSWCLSSFVTTQDFIVVVVNVIVVVFVDDQGRVTESSQTKRGVHPKMIVLLCRQACLDCSCCSYCSCCSCCCLR